MKFLKYIFILPIFFMSCTDFGDINVDPDVSPSANPKEVLTSSQGFLAWVLEAQMNDRNSLWGQYVTWGPGVALGNVERYLAEPADYNNEWARAYSNTLADLKFLTESGDQTYSGIAKIIMASTYQILADNFGDIPFSEALKGEVADGAIFSPVYDDDKAVYAGLVTLIDQGISEINAGSTTIGTEDLMFGGDLSKWVKYGNSLKLRILMRQSVTGDQAAIGNAVRTLVANGNFMETNADIADIAFVGTAGSENPMFADYERSLGNFFVASNSALDALANDPRLSKFFNPAVNGGGFKGIDQGAIDNEGFTAVTNDYSQVTALAYRKDAPVIFMSDWEVWFLRAEADLRYGTIDDATTAFNRAIQSSFDYTGAGDATAFNGTLDFEGKSDGDKLRLLAKQKWISMLGLQETEGWTEARRLDTPDTKFFTGGGGLWKTPLKSALGPGVFPTLNLYPESEQSYNPNAPAQRLLTDKAFWDN